MIHKQNNLLDQIVWFKNKVKYEIDFFDVFTPRRMVSKKARYKSGIFHSDKCNRDIQYESGIELEFIKFLEQSQQVLYYWEQPVQIEFRLRTGKKLTYTPDFALYLKTKHIVLVEIKDLTSMLKNNVQMKIEGLIDFCSKKGFGLLLTDGKYTLDKIKNTRYNEELEKAILAALSDKQMLRKEECKEILKRYRSTQNELFKIIIKNNLKFNTFSYKIEQNNKNKVFRHVFIDGKPYEEYKDKITESLFRKSSNF